MCQIENIHKLLVPIHISVNLEGSVINHTDRDTIMRKTWLPFKDVGQIYPTLHVH